MSRKKASSDFSSLTHRKILLRESKYDTIDMVIFVKLHYKGEKAMSILLNVPYAEKDEAKSLGAKWDPNLKKWYAVRDYPKFRKWISIKKDRNMFYVISDYIYVVEGMRKCHKCHNITPVICFGFEKFWTIYKDSELECEYYNEELILSITARFDPMPTDLLTLVQKTYNFKKAYSRMAGESYWGNCCEHCKSLQGDFYLFEEPGSPFAQGKEKNLKLYTIRLKYDFVVDDIQQGDNDCIDMEQVRKIAYSIDISDTIQRMV